MANIKEKIRNGVKEDGMHSLSFLGIVYKKKRTYDSKIKERNGRPHNQDPLAEELTHLPTHKREVEKKMSGDVALKPDLDFLSFH